MAKNVVTFATLGQVAGTKNVFENGESSTSELICNDTDENSKKSGIFTDFFLWLNF